MKKMLLILTGLFLFFNANAQSDEIYQEFIARAGLYHLQKDYKNAVILYEKAFQIKPPDALNAYKAAGVYSLDHKIDQSLYFLRLSLKTGWVEADQLISDPYFDNLKHHDPLKWKQITEDAAVTEERYARGLSDPSLRKRINLMMLNDQRLRYLRVQTKNIEEQDSINRAIHLADSVNRLQARVIITDYGWPKLSDIGSDGQNNLWLLIQHADGDIPLQQSALQAMQKLKIGKEVNAENYAFLYDRIQCNLNYKQLYGTQVNWTERGEANGFRTIRAEDLVDLRRSAMGLLPLRIYAMTYGFTYSARTADEVKTLDSIEQATTKGLIDSAKLYFVKHDYNKAYDYYNRASSIAGGMSNTDNYEAARFFAIVAKRDKDPKYKSIALDFLNLLFLRKELTQQLLSDQAFKTLHTEPRWKLISG